MKNLIIAAQQSDKGYFSGHARGLYNVGLCLLSRFHVSPDTKTAFHEVALSQGIRCNCLSHRCDLVQTLSCDLVSSNALPTKIRKNSSDKFLTQGKFLMKELRVLNNEVPNNWQVVKKHIF